MDAFDPPLDPPPVAHAPPPRAELGATLKAFAFDAAIAIVTLFGVTLLCSGLWGFWRGMQLEMAQRPADTAHIGQPGGGLLMFIAVAGTGSAALLTYFWRRRASAAERAQSARQARQPATWVWALIIGFATFLFNAIAMTLAARVGVRAMATNTSLLHETIVRQPWLLWLVAGMLAPLYEELLFRRVLFGRFWAAGWPWLGAVLSALLFALLHEVPGQGSNTFAATTVLWLSYGVMGFAFAWTYRHTGTLWGAIGAHAVNNLLACSMLALGT